MQKRNRDTPGQGPLSAPESPRAVWCVCSLVTSTMEVKGSESGRKGGRVGPAGAEALSISTVRLHDVYTRQHIRLGRCALS